MSISQGEQSTKSVVQVWKEVPVDLLLGIDVHSGLGSYSCVICEYSNSATDLTSIQH